MGMMRVLSTPDKPATSKASKFIANSGAQMQKLSDLDRKSRHATMRTQSNVFSQTMPANGLKDLLGRGKGGSKGRRGDMGSILAHDQGPLNKVEWHRKKTAVQDKVSQQDPKAVSRETFKKVMTAKKEPTRTAKDRNASQVF